ncbi:MAG: hypothetical protein NTX21_11120 [Alphaproteobacteria bacterium]|nr:hypothetical protein [Alphaproteobacteria bacterium]
MKRLISAALALTLLGAPAASAQGYRGGYGGYGHGGYGHGGYRRGYGHGGGWHRRGDAGALLGLGFGLFALGAMAAASDRDRYYERYDYGPPPPAYYGRYG